MKAHRGRRRCCRTWFASRGHGMAVLHSGAACMCGCGRGNHGHTWMSTSSRGSTHPKHHRLHRETQKAYCDGSESTAFSDSPLGGAVPLRTVDDAPCEFLPYDWRCDTHRGRRRCCCTRGSRAAARCTRRRRRRWRTGGCGSASPPRRRPSMSSRRTTRPSWCLLDPRILSELCVFDV